MGKVEGTAPYTVLLTGLENQGPAIRNYLRRQNDLRLIEVGSSEISTRGPETSTDQHADVVVVGSGLIQPLAVAGRLRQRSPHAQIVFLVSADRMDRFRASLPFVPQLSDAWTAAAEDSEDAGAVILEAARAARRYEAVATVFDRINRQISSKRALEEATRRERQLSLSERFMATVLVQAPDPIFAVNSDGEIISANNAAGHLFLGYQNGTVGQPVLSIFPDAVRAEIKALLARARSGETFERFETLIAVGENATRNAAISLASIRDISGGMVGYAVTMRDITDLKRAEQERKRLDEIEDLLQRRQNVESLGQMASSIAHEINQPLGAIVTNGSAALRWLNRDKPDLAEARTSIDRIIKDGTRATQIISSIRSMVKMGSHEKVQVDLNGLVNDVLALVQGEIKHNQVVVERKLINNLPRITADPVQLQQVILNLIVNAIQAMTSVVARMRLLQVKTDIVGSEVALTIEDSGSGITSENISRIFEPFFTTKPNGMGMGLSICRSIIEAHGGNLSVSSAQPQGSAFRVMLPFEKA
jgi:PAS domain S-box-containing protein